MHKIILALLILACCSTPALAQQTDQTHFRFGSVIDPSTFTGQYQKRILTEAFRRNGWTLEIVHPEDGHTVASMVDKGLLDGDSQRVSNFADAGDHPGYVKINESTFSLKVSAYSKIPYEAETWADIGRLDVLIGHRSGIEIVERELRKNAPPGNIRSYPTRLDGMRALRDGEIEIFVISNQYHARKISRSEEFNGSGVCKLTTLESADMYAYFSRKHAALAPVIAETIHHMQHEGVLKKILVEIMTKGPTN